MGEFLVDDGTTSRANHQKKSWQNTYGRYSGTLPENTVRTEWTPSVPKPPTCVYPSTSSSSPFPECFTLCVYVRTCHLPYGQRLSCLPIYAAIAVAILNGKGTGAVPPTMRSIPAGA